MVPAGGDEEDLFADNDSADMHDFDWSASEDKAASREIEKSDVNVETNIEVSQLFSETPPAAAPPSAGVSNSEEDQETAQELLELKDRWTVVRWGQFKGRILGGTEFWEEPAVKNIKHAVQMKYMSKDVAAGLLGIKNKKMFETFDDIMTGVPVIIQDMIDLWGIVQRDEFKESGKRIQQFWKEPFVRKVLYVVQKKFLTASGAAQVLGVKVRSVQEIRKKIFSTASLVIKPKEIISESHDYDTTANTEKDENNNTSWWEKLAPVDTGIPDNDQWRIMNSRIWIVFLQFSQVEIKDMKAEFNPYKAGMPEFADFLQFLQLTNNWPVGADPETGLASLAECVPHLGLPPSVQELMTSHPPRLCLEDLKSCKKQLLPFSPFDSTWSNFCEFCEKSCGGVDPFLAKPVLVNEFLISKFEGKEMKLEELQPKEYMRSIPALENESFFRPAHSFYRDNLARLLSELDWHLQHSWLAGPLKDSQELELLSRAAVSCDERLVTNNIEMKDLVLKISPNNAYTKVRTNHSEELFWGRKFTKNILNDVRNQAVPASVAASGLGVTAEMIFFAIKQFTSATDKNTDQDNPTEVIAVKDYVFLGYGTKSQFWKEQSIVDLLEDVRNRNVAVEKLAALIGVSMREVLERCGGVKEEAEREAEQTLAAIEKMRKMAQEELIVKKKKTQLEIQIEMAEKNVESLSEYEIMRLKNMKERQALVESLDFDKEKREIKALTPINQPRQVKAVQLREKSARVKRRSEVEQLKNLKMMQGCSKTEWMMLQESRSSPSWFGHWVPRTRQFRDRQAMAVSDIDVSDVYDEKAISLSNHVPKYKLRAQELLEITPGYHKSRTLLDSFAADFKQVRAEKKLVAKTEWSKVELVQDSMVSNCQLTSLDSCNEYICFGTMAGGVGVTMAGRAFTIRPHNRQVTRTMFLGSRNSPWIMSAALDGTVRMTDLVQQTVCLEYSWDQSYSGKQGVTWMEKRGVYSLLLDCGNEINQIDIRSRDAFQLFEVEANPYSLTNLSVHPANKNLVSLCRGGSLQVWDLRKASYALVTLSGPSGTRIAGGGWSSAGIYLVTCVAGGGVNTDATVVYNGSDFSKMLDWKGPRKTTFSPATGVVWCPWEEPLFFTTMEQVNWSRKHDIKTSPAVVAVDCVSGKVVGEFMEGLEYSSYLVHGSNSQEVVVVGNNKGPGGMAVFKVVSD